MLQFLHCKCLPDFSLLFQTQAATGIDGYYYVLQIETLRNQGHFYFPTHTPLVPYLLKVLSFLMPNAIFAVKIGGILLHMFLSFAVFALVTTLTRNVWLGLFGLLITAFSALHFYMISEFLSNLGALAFLVWSVFGIVKAIQTKKYLWFIFSILFSICALFSHRSAFGLIVLFGLTTLSAYLLLNCNPKFSRRFLVFSAILFFLPFIFSRQSFFTLPEWLAFELLKTPKSPFRSMTLAENLMLAIGLFLTIFIWIRFRQVFEDKFISVMLFSIMLFSFLLTLNPFLNHQSGFQGIIGRLDGLAYLQAATALPILVSI